MYIKLLPYHNDTKRNRIAVFEWNNFVAKHPDIYEVEVISVSRSFRTTNLKGDIVEKWTGRELFWNDGGSAWSNDTFQEVKPLDIVKGRLKV